MLTHVKALVRGIDNQGILHQALLLQIVQHPADIAIDGVDHPAVIVHITLEFPFR